MASLIFIGLGLYGEKGLSLKSLEELKDTDVVYLERYTSPTPQDISSKIESIIGRPVKDAGRELVEDGRQIIGQAKKGKVALITYGDPMVATTHMDLNIRARQEGVTTSIIHNSSILSALPGEVGLHIYKFGKTVTLTRSPHQTTVYNTVFENLLHGLHTTILLEYNNTVRDTLQPNEGFRILLDTERDLRQNVFTDETFLIVASRIGLQDQSIVGGTIGRLKDMEFASPPHTLVVPGDLHFTEVEALKTILKMGEDHIQGNSSRVQRLASTMISKYVAKSRRALAKAVELCGAEERVRFRSLFENVECYISDSERFLHQGRDELAVLSIGYAEGLLDSLRLQFEAKFKEIWD